MKDFTNQTLYQHIIQTQSQMLAACQLRVHAY